MRYKEYNECKVVLSFYAPWLRQIDANHTCIDSRDKHVYMNNAKVELGFTNKF